MPPRRRTATDLRLPAAVVSEVRAGLPEVAEEVVTAVIAEVPSYTDAFSGPMGATIRNAVQVALGGFLSLASGKRGADLRTPNAPAVEGAYQLGRGEARSGRTTDALLAAYRIGARVAWQQMSGHAVRAGLEADELAAFAGLVFAYIDELSAASVAGHTDELASTGRVRQRRLERLAHHLLTGSPEETAVASAERADWPPPETLTAVLLDEAQVRPALNNLPGATLVAAEAPGLDDGVLLLVPDMHGRRRAALLRALADRSATVGPPRPWLHVRTSVDRAMRARALDRECPPTPRRTWPSSCSPPTPRRSPTCAPVPSSRSTACDPPPPRSSPPRCGSGCCARAGVTRWRPRCSCTPRPCATGWARSARRSATGSTTPTSSAPW